MTGCPHDPKSTLDFQFLVLHIKLGLFNGLLAWQPYLTRATLTSFMTRADKFTVSIYSTLLRCVDVEPVDFGSWI